MLTLIAQRDIPSSLYFSPCLPLAAPACSILQLIALVLCSCFPLCLLFLHLKSPPHSARLLQTIYKYTPQGKSVNFFLYSGAAFPPHFCSCLLKGHVTLKTDVSEHKERLVETVGVETIQLPELFVFIRKGKGRKF